MKSLMLLLPLVMLVGCVARPQQDFVFPELPPLSEEAQRDCPAAPPVTGTLGDLASKDAALAIEYAKCRVRHATSVAAYNDARRLLAEAKAAAEAKARR